MRHVPIIIFLCSVCSTCTALAQKFDPCNVYGKIYIQPVKAFADLVVYIEENEAFADLVVYKQQNKYFADRVGHWFMTENKSEADFWVYIETSHKPSAHLSIFFTNTESFAGCKR